jgi:hypothetical protein
MGEAKQKSRRRAEIIADELRCVYCASPPTTVEHMPPVGMFRGRQRLSGLEFACCDECNNGTRAADLVAGFMARISPTNDVTEWNVEEAYQLIGKIADLAPDVIVEVFSPGKARRAWMRKPSGLIERVQVLQLDGPVLKSLMTVFTAKMGMALYREHVGSPLPMNGGVYTQFYFNHGLNRSQLEITLRILPASGNLTQGRRSSSGQFDYRYNCDDKSILMALCGFHSNLHVRALATATPEPYAHLLEEYNSDFVRPGELGERSRTRRKQDLERTPKPGGL